jgi:hypothetical protein
MTEHEDNKPEGWDLLGEAWRSATSPSLAEVNVDAVRKRADAFARTIRRRNMREFVAGALIVLAGLAIGVAGRGTLDRIGGGLLALGAVVVCVVLVRKGSDGPAPAPDEPTHRVLAYERHELERQAELLSHVWLWYLGPVIPGVVVLLIDGVLRNLERGRGVVDALVAALIVTLVFFGVGLLNRHGARQLRARLARIPADASSRSADSDADGR